MTLGKPSPKSSYTQIRKPVTEAVIMTTLTSSFSQLFHQPHSICVLLVWEMKPHSKKYNIYILKFPVVNMVTVLYKYYILYYF